MENRKEFTMEDFKRMRETCKRVYEEEGYCVGRNIFSENEVEEMYLYYQYTTNYFAGCGGIVSGQKIRYTTYDKKHVNHVAYIQNPPMEKIFELFKLMFEVECIEAYVYDESNISNEQGRFCLIALEDTEFPVLNVTLLKGDIIFLHKIEKTNQTPLVIETI